MTLFLPPILGFLSAAFALILAAILASIFYLPPTEESTFMLTSWPQLLLFAAIEEGSKALFLWRGRQLNRGIYPFASYAVLFALGFASVEYLFLLFGSLSWAWASLGILAVHLLTTVVLASLLWSRVSVGRFVLGLAGVTLLHFAYNLVLLTL